MESPLLIVNPTCGSADRSRKLSVLLAETQRVLGEVAVRETTHRGHAAALAAEGAREGRPLIVAVGGDGTFSEVVHGVLTAGGASLPSSDMAESGPAPSGPAVGLIDAGTGGDFRRSLGIGTGLQACLEALSSGREQVVDVGRASFLGADGKPVECYFVNVLSAGLGGLVDRYVETTPGFLGGTAAYYVASLRAVLDSREQPLLARITWDRQTREEVIPAHLVAICNGRWFGGGMDIAPMASPCDGCLEVLTITERNRFFLAAKIRKVYTGRHLEERTVAHFPCTRIELSLADRAAERCYLLDVDGDPLGSLPLSVEVLPSALRVRA